MIKIRGNDLTKREVIRMGEIGLNTNQLQKCLIFLLLQKKYNKAGFFQEIKAYLKRSTSQTSDILTKLEHLGYIERHNTRPQENYITDLGESILTKTFIAPSKEILLKLYNDIPHLETTKNLEKEKQEQLKIRQIVIQKTLHLISSQLDQDLKNISEYITKDQYENLTSSITSSIEHILSFVLQRLSIQFINRENRPK